MMLKLGFSGMIAVAPLLRSSAVCHREDAPRPGDIKIESLTAQVREVASERDRLLNANWSLTMASRSRMTPSWDYPEGGWHPAAEGRPSRAKEAQSVRERWKPTPVSLMGRRMSRRLTTRFMQKWNCPDTAPHLRSLDNLLDGIIFNQVGHGAFGMMGRHCRPFFR